MSRKNNVVCNISVSFSIDKKYSRKKPKIKKEEVSDGIYDLQYVEEYLPF